MKSLAEHLGVQDPTKPDEPVATVEHPVAASVSVFCQDILNTKEYRDSLLRRILLDELPPAIEAMLWDRAYGRMKDHVGLSGAVAVTRVVREIVDVTLDENESPKNGPSVH